MRIRSTGSPTNITTNPEIPEEPAKKTPISKGIADTPDSFERPQSRSIFYQNFGILGGPSVGTLIGSAIGQAANNGEEDGGKKSTSKNSHIQLQPLPMQSDNANQTALEGAEKQEELFKKQKKPRRQSYSITPPDSD